jgi:DNA-binding transcriptional regulator YiaG
MTPTQLRRLRRHMGLSQAGFAALVGVAPNTVARWERGELGLRTTSARLIELVAGHHGTKKKRTKEKGR